MNPADFLQDLFRAAVAAANPMICLPSFLPPPPRGRTVVVGAGKAAAAMARAVETHWPGDLSGFVATRYGHGAPCEKIEVAEAAHPVPDNAGLRAARRVLELVSGLSEDDLVIFLGSGGGSSLLVLPAPGLVIEDKQTITRVLLRSGASIAEINCVRKHLSAIKGGRLALAAAPARVCGLLISDVVGDDPATIASGPTVPDPTTRDEALEVLARYRVPVEKRIAAHLSRQDSESPKNGHVQFARTKNTIIANARTALDAAMRKAEEAGTRAILLDHAMEGDVREAARRHAREAIEIAARADVESCVLLSGGELTVKVTGDGRGGRNTEFLLALALEYEAHSGNGHPGIWAIACDTDGVDGSEDNAGAILTPDTLGGARSRGLDAREYLARNDAYGYFEGLAALVRTGPTRTNVNDFRAVLIRKY